MRVSSSPLSLIPSALLHLLCPLSAQYCWKTMHCHRRFLNLLGSCSSLRRDQQDSGRYRAAVPIRQSSNITESGDSTPSFTICLSGWMVIPQIRRWWLWLLSYADNLCSVIPRFYYVAIYTTLHKLCSVVKASHPNALIIKTLIWPIPSVKYLLFPGLLTCKTCWIWLSYIHFKTWFKLRI